MASLRIPRKQNDSMIGKPIHYISGPLSGRTIRSELHEYQKPDLGRKFAKRDRRPLDPPPVVRLRMFEVFNQGSSKEHEEEMHADDIDISGLVAHIDLFPVPPPAPSSSSSSSSTPASMAPFPSSISPSDPQRLPQSLGKRKRPFAIPTDPTTGEPSNVTHSLFGSSFVHAVHMLDMSGEPVVFFVFSDLSVRLEGYFTLRYRYFDLFSRTAESEDVPVAAELYSGVFVIYSTKEFPGLQASTALTKHLSRWGVRVNLREGERHRTRGGANRSDDSSSGEAEGDPEAPGFRRG